MGKAKLALYVLYICLLVWPFGLLLSFKLPFVLQTTYLLDFVVGILFLFCLFTGNIRKKAKASPLLWPLIIFLGISTFSLIINFYRLTVADITTASLYLLRLVVYPSVYFVTLGEDQEELRKFIFISIFIFLSLALLQYLFLPDLRYLKLLGFDDHYYRLVGTLYDPNYTGAIISAIALVFLSSGPTLILFGLICLLALTFSRASYLSFISVLALHTLSLKKTKILLLLALFCLIVYLIPKPFGEGVNLLRTFSIFSRLNSWSAGINIFLQKPIFGWGYNTLGNINGQKLSIDNSFIYLLATTGLAGFFSFIYLLKKIFQLVPNTNKLMLISLLIHSLFNNSLFFIWIYFVFWLTLNLKIKDYK